FKNKEDILISVFKEKMGNFVEQIKKNIDKKPTTSDKLFTLISTHFEQLAKNHHLAVVTQLELRQSKKALRFEINNDLEYYLNVINEVIQYDIDHNILCNTITIS